MATPRVFIVRHGETEWSLNGRHTGTTELPLTANGEKRIRATGQALVGEDRLIVPSQLAHIYVSPRKRAQRTFELLNLGCKQKLPWQEQSQSAKEQHVRTDAKVQVTDDIREWDYGDYEGLTSATIREQRNQSGEEPWDIWRDGCPSGDDSKGPSDVLLVAHGHILRAFAMRWIKRELTEGVSLLLEAGGVGTLSIDEPAILLGGSFTVDVLDNHHAGK
ncbi:MAG: hypothetical protein Q9197_006780 [Variospora fuerteventurae]